MRTIDDVRQEIQKAYTESQSWRVVARAFGISTGTAWRIVNDGYDPKDPEDRERLGLPVLALAPTCPKCKVVHVAARCPGHAQHALPARYRDWPVAALRYALEHREAMS